MRTFLAVLCAAVVGGCKRIPASWCEEREGTDLCACLESVQLAEASGEVELAAAADAGVRCYAAVRAGEAARREVKP